MTPLGVLLALGIGLVLGLLGGGGSILAVPTFLYVFHVEAKPAIAMSLVVVGMSALVGFVTHWRQGTINVRIALGFGALAMIGTFAMNTSEGTMRKPPPAPMSAVSTPTATAWTPSRTEKRNGAVS